MKILQMHVDFIEYTPVKKEIRASRGDRSRTVRRRIVVVLFTAVEQGDDDEAREEGRRRDKGVPREARDEPGDDLSLRAPEPEPRAAVGSARPVLTEMEKEAEGRPGSRRPQGAVRLEQGPPGQGEGSPARGDVKELRHAGRARYRGQLPPQARARELSEDEAFCADQEERLRASAGDRPQGHRREAGPVQLPGTLARDGVLARQGAGGSATF